MMLSWSSFGLFSWKWYVIGMSNAAVAWCTQRQESIALFTQQSEIVAGSMAACELVAFNGLLDFVGKNDAMLPLRCSFHRTVN